MSCRLATIQWHNYKFCTYKNLYTLTAHWFFVAAKSCSLFYIIEQSIIISNLWRWNYSSNSLHHTVYKGIYFGGFSGVLEIPKILGCSRNNHRSQGITTLVSCARLCVGSQKQSDHCCTHSGTIAGKPIRSLCTFYDEPNNN